MSHGGLGIEHLRDVEPMRPTGHDDLFTATDLKLDRRVAVRLLPAIVSEGERSRFLDRARALAGLSGQANIVTVFDAGISPDGRPYVVTELVDGPDLADRLESGGPQPWPEATRLTLQLAAGLDQIHQVGGRHHDLRPENILLAGSTATLTDVGLLPRAEAGPESPATLAHRAPETLGADGDERSDLYSLTSILYRMIDGRAPFWRPDDTVEALRARLLTQAAPPLDPDLVPPALAVFVTAGLSADPLDRPQHIGEFSAELRLIVEGRVTGSTPSVLHAASGPVPLVPTTASPTSVMSTAVVGPAAPPVDDWPSPAPLAFAPPTTEIRVVSPDLEPPAFEPQPLAFEPEPPAFDPTRGPATPDDHTTLIPTIEPDPGPIRGPGRPPLLVAAGAMIAVGLLGLVAVLAIGLRDSGGDGQTAAPALPDPEALTEAGTGEVVEGAPTTLTPLAMLPESTTTTDPDEMVTSTDTAVRRVVVPDLVSIDVSVAGQRLSDAGFDILVVGRVSPGSIPGTVIQQTPAAGSTIELPATVTLFIPRSATLPSMVGRPADTVCLQLTALGLRCEQTLRFDERVAPGAVIATNPTEGSAFTDGQTIRVDVSRGPLTEARIPPVTGLNEDEARTALGAAGFVAVSTVSLPSNDVPAGQAIGTDPAAGTSLTIDQPVVIQISSGPAPMVTVPELVGLDRAAAEAALQRAQLAGTFVVQNLPAGDPNIGLVLTVDPAAATQLPAGSSVTVTVGQVAEGSSSTTSTTVAGGG